jgi:lipopolysaccharide transport system permease protein
MGVIKEERKWKEVISSRNNILSLNVKELWAYRDLLFILIRRDILAVYKQTILGPLWFFLQPALTTLMFIIIFSRIGRFSTGELPPVLFYLSGLVAWSYFSECITRTSSFLKDNTQIFTKVYFPRIIVPVSLVITNLVKFGIQLALFILIYFYFLFTSPGLLEPNSYLLLLPVLVILTGLLGLGLGMIISSLTTRYKDLMHLISFGVQLLMFASPVIFPLSAFKNSGLYRFILANPMTGIIEAFRYGFTGKGFFSWSLLGYDAASIAVLLILGIIVFNSVEKSFVDNI